MTSPKNKDFVLDYTKHKVIAILDFVYHSLIKLNCHPNYLHIHILESEKGQKFPDILKHVNSKFCT